MSTNGKLVLHKPHKEAIIERAERDTYGTYLELIAASCNGDNLQFLGRELSTSAKPMKKKSERKHTLKYM